MKRAIAFVRELGIAVRVHGGATGFLQRIDVLAGGLVVEPRCSASNILHEANHLAMIPGQFRPLANGDLTCVTLAMHVAVEQEDVDSLLASAILHSGEAEVTGWVWAARIRCGCPKHRSS